MIDFTRAFESAWERMMVILFRPFDLAKWCVIGFSAFLAGLLTGGNGVNGGGNVSQNLNNSFKPGQLQVNTSTSGNAAQLQQITDQFHHFFTTWGVGLIIGFVAIMALFVVVLVLLFFWLGSRGQFLFLDNIVRNRAEIGWPWRAYARPANSFFLFYLALEFFVFLLMAPILVVAIIVCLPLFQHQRWPAGTEIWELAGLGVVYFVIGIGAAVMLFFFREFGIPIMFRQGIPAQAAFAETLRLIARNPGNVTLFFLLRIALFVAMAIICLILCCGSCCTFLIPYLGTIYLLPVLVFLRCFTLDCLAQMAPEYDVFTVDVRPGATPEPPSPLNRPPPPG